MESKAEKGNSSLNTNAGKKKKTLIFAFLLFVVTFFLVSGVVVFLVLNGRQDEDSQQHSDGNEQEVQDNKDQTNISELQTYTYTKDDGTEVFSVTYPKDWEIEAEDCNGGVDECPKLTVKSGNYEWELLVDPIYTGGGVGYMFDGILSSDSESEESVSPSGVDAILRTVYVSQSDYDDMYENSFNLGENAWGGSVVFTENESEFSSPGFSIDGSKYEHDEIKWNYFGIVYKYKSDKEDMSDIPHKGDDELEENIKIMNEITNSFKILTDIKESQTGFTSECENIYSLSDSVVELDSVQAGDKISSPLQLKGRIRGSWCFEASCQVEIYDSDGQKLFSGNFMLVDDWMTDSLVDFEIEVEFELEEADSGYLIFVKSNPSGLEKNCGEVHVPINFN